VVRWDSQVLPSLLFSEFRSSATDAWWWLIWGNITRAPGRWCRRSLLSWVLGRRFGGLRFGGLRFGGCRFGSGRFGGCRFGFLGSRLIVVRIGGRQVLRLRVAHRSLSFGGLLVCTNLGSVLDRWRGGSSDKCVASLVDVARGWEIDLFSFPHANRIEKVAVCFLVGQTLEFRELLLCLGYLRLKIVPQRFLLRSIGPLGPWVRLLVDLVQALCVQRGSDKLFRPLRGVRFTRERHIVSMMHNMFRERRTFQILTNPYSPNRSRERVEHMLVDYTG
jgi:hypothetical protein